MLNTAAAAAAWQGVLDEIVEQVSRNASRAGCPSAGKRVLTVSRSQFVREATAEAVAAGRASQDSSSMAALLGSTRLSRCLVKEVLQASLRGVGGDSMRLVREAVRQAKMGGDT